MSIRRSILRYALQCPDAAAVRFVEMARNASPTDVKNNETLLQLESQHIKAGP